LWLASKVFAPLLLIAFLVARFRRNAISVRESPPNQVLVLCFLAGFFALLAGGSSLSLPRINCAVAFAYILGASMLAEFGQRRLIAGVLALAVALGCIEMAVAAIRPAYRFAAPRGAILLLSRDRYQMISWFSLNAHPGDQLFGDPDLNFVLDLWNPAGVQWVEPGAFTRPDQVSELLSALQRNHTRFVIWSDFVDRPGPGDNLQPLRAYLKERYHPAQKFGAGVEILAADETTLQGGQSAENVKGSH
jgi:hypothetical protein